MRKKKRVELTTEGVSAHGQEVDALDLGEPRVSDLAPFDDDSLGQVAKTVQVVARLAGVPPSTIEALNLHDFQKLSAVVEGFFEGLGLLDSQD